MGKLPEVAIELVVGIFANGTSVENHDVCGVWISGLGVASRLEQTRQTLRIMHVHLAAKRAHVVAALRGRCGHPEILLREFLLGVLDSCKSDRTGVTLSSQKPEESALANLGL